MCFSAFFARVGIMVYKKAARKLYKATLFLGRFTVKMVFFIQEKFALETTFISLRVANGKFTASLVNY